MKITTLLENESIDSNLVNAHGLSLYVEFNGLKILFDKGPKKQYYKNAKKLGIDISDIDYLVVSHGHFDHARGLNSFLKINKKAKIIISKDAFNKFYKKSKNLFIPIGIKQPNNDSRLIYIDKDITVCDGFHIISDVEPVDQIIKDESLLTRNNENSFVTDYFDHEIYMVLEEDKNTTLFSGCSHKGIEHIIDSIEAKIERECTAVIGGYHFSHYDSSNMKEFMYLEKLAGKWNAKTDCVFYTGHCTGADAYLDLKQNMSTNLIRIKTGSTFTV